MKLSSPSSLSSSSALTTSGGSSDLQDRLSAAASSIPTSDGSGILDLDQDPPLSRSTGVGMAHPSMRPSSTESLHPDSQLLVEPTGKSVDLLDVVDRFAATGGVDDAASFSNRLARGDTLVNDSGFVSSLFPTSRVASTTQVNLASLKEQTVSFAYDIAGNSFGGASGVTCLRAREDLKAPSRYQSPGKTTTSEEAKKGGVDKLVKLLRIRPGDIGISICGGKLGKTGIHACAAQLAFGASCGIKAHSVKAQDPFVDALYIQAPSKNSKAQPTVYLTPILTIDDIDREMIDTLLATERTISVRTTLLPSLISLTSEECVALVKSVDSVVEAKADYFTPKKPKKEEAFLQHSSFITTQLVDPTVDFDVLLNAANFPPFFERLCSTVDSLQHATLLLKNNSLALNKQFALRDSTFGGELSMLEDKLGSDPGLTDVHLRTAWEGIHFVHSVLLDVINNGSSSSLQLDDVQRLLSPFISTVADCNSKLTNLESVFVNTLPRLTSLYSVCSGGENKPPAEALTSRLNRMTRSLQTLELQSSTPSSSFSLGNGSSFHLGNGTLPPPPSSSSTALLELQGLVSSIESQIIDLKSSISQEVVVLGGVKFESLRQTTQWVRANLPSGAYHLFHDTPTLLDAFDGSHLSTKDFLDETYHAARGGHFDNASEARASASFARELPPIFGKVASSTSTSSSSTIHPLPSMKAYVDFNSTDIGIKQTIIDEMDNVVDSITSDVSACLHSSPVALMLANTLLVQSKSIVDSLLTWIESFYQELKMGSHSSPKDAWLLVCSCVRAYFKTLRKVRAPAQAASNMSSKMDRAGAYLWAIAQSHRVSRVFVLHRWREHPVVAGVINFHLFRFMVPLAAHKQLQQELESIKKLDKERQAEISKNSTRLKQLESRNKKE